MVSLPCNVNTGPVLSKTTITVLDLVGAEFPEASFKSNEIEYTPEVLQSKSETITTLLVISPSVGS